MSDHIQAATVNGPTVTADTILAWIQEWTEANNLQVPTDLEQTFADAGFDSMHSVELAFFLEERLNIKIDDTVLYDYPTFNALAEHLVSLQRQDTSAAAEPGEDAGAGSW
ncbi:acyl carrier protein [Burkholderia contaminans]|uniref:Phosphopantetheine-binding protein n=1 Tax=Burkholderia contaminans TaxID=488447 RepID=A0A3N8QZI8_9BURK|nr:acyl carrier protein [Burkholderia contaminans]AKM45098.1 phosphopantetheine-binding protein [Burkholderia contaminans]ELK6464850.1 acyl carrier protein [Burkholderia contaminans]RQT29174.1 phosphopantetheine-binding protein [Burkholderia contaminans]VWD08607.1 phosphopantetheine-binding protein [Burkholderia contaminans]